jgi:hypothetical protein|tara:strand:+ start:984 stop:1187 length:204 start_codon:yes stop_codon:yes gene_type:complete
MILLDLHVDIDEEDEDIRVLRFDFTNNTRLTFECPTGLSALDALDAFREFIDKAEEIIESQENVAIH